MSPRSLNKAMLIGNLTRDPELRFTPQGTAVCTFGLATNRSWMPEGATERREETEFHRVVAWNKLAELCSQLLTKGRKVYVEGRISTRTWTGQDGAQRTTTEIVIEDMILLDSQRQNEVASTDSEPAVASNATSVAIETATATSNVVTAASETLSPASNAVSAAGDDDGAKKKKQGKHEEPKDEKEKEEKEQSANINPDDIPF